MRIDSQSESNRKKKRKNSEKRSTKTNNWENEVFMFMQKSMEAGMNAHLSKPIDMAELKDVLEKLVCSERSSGHHESDGAGQDN